jgi:hypothetical protein
MLIVAATLAALLALLTTYIALLSLCGTEGRAVGERQASGSDVGADRGP